MIAKERLYLNKDKTKIVKEGSPEAASLLCAVGQTVPVQYRNMVSGGSKMKPAPDNKGLTVNKSKDKR